MKSLKSFLDTHTNVPHGLKISNNVYLVQPYLEEIPLYGIDAWIKKS